MALKGLKKILLTKDMFYEWYFISYELGNRAAKRMLILNNIVQ